jgi:3-dehydroquinate synthase
MKQRFQVGPIAETLPPFLEKKKYSQPFILTDENTGRFCLPFLLEEVPALNEAHVITVYAGEKNKTLAAAEYVWKQLTEKNADRKAVLLNLGGGLVGDLGGFAASTYKRGIEFIHLPTSLLAQVDASIGGKQGIDFLHYKNQIGVFRLPAAVFTDQRFLQTLPEEQLLSGFAEVIKHALLAGGKLWKKTSAVSDLKEVDWENTIRQSMEVKLSVVEADPEEKNLRKILNFGHTLGHAMESFLLGKGEDPLHGHCVAAGMMGELFLSRIVCGLPEDEMQSAARFIAGMFPALNWGENDFESILQWMKQDKKNENGKIRFVLLEKIGQSVMDREADEGQIDEALRFILSAYAHPKKKSS